MAVSFESEYLRFIKDKPLFGSKLNIVERFYYDDSTSLFTTGDGVGIYGEECGSEFNCFKYDYIVIAVPKQCELIKDKKWEFKQYSYMIVTNIDPYNPFQEESLKTARALIQVSDKKRIIGHFIHSPEKGVEAFSFKGEKRKSGDIDFYRTSEVGMLSGGCSLPKERYLKNKTNHR